MQGLHRVLNMPNHALMREYALITLNMIEYAGIHLKKQSAEYARILMYLMQCVAYD